MKYRVGDVARVLGLTPGALHYYEREGLMSVKRAQSGHRFYDDADLWRLLSYKKYHAMGSPIKEIMNQFTGGGARDEVERRVRARRDEALEKSRHYAALARQIEEHLEGIERVDELLNRHTFERSPEVLFAHDGQGGWIALERTMQEHLNAWVEAMPAVRLAMRWPIESFEPEALEVSAAFGYAVGTEHAVAGALSQTPGVYAMGAMSCLHTVVTTGHDFVYRPHTAFLPAVAYARARGLHLAGAPWGTILLVETDPSGLFRAYIEVWIPIQ